MELIFLLSLVAFTIHYRVLAILRWSQQKEQKEIEQTVYERRCSCLFAKGLY